MRKPPSPTRRDGWRLLLLLIAAVVALVLLSLMSGCGTLWRTSRDVLAGAPPKPQPDAQMERHMRELLAFARGRVRDDTPVYEALGVLQEQIGVPGIEIAQAKMAATIRRLSTENQALRQREIEWEGKVAEMGMRLGTETKSYGSPFLASLLRSVLALAVIAAVAFVLGGAGVGAWMARKINAARRGVEALVQGIGAYRKEAKANGGAEAIGAHLKMALAGKPGAQALIDRTRRKQGV